MVMNLGEVDRRSQEDVNNMMNFAVTDRVSVIGKMNPLGGLNEKAELMDWVCFLSDRRWARDIVVYRKLRSQVDIAAFPRLVGVYRYDPA